MTICLWGHAECFKTLAGRASRQTPDPLTTYDFSGTRKSQTTVVEKYAHSWILPHELSAARSADMSTAMSHSDFLDFWSHASSTEWYASHPYKDMIASSPSTVMPLRLHRDDCKGFTILSWCPIGRQFSNRMIFTLWDHDSVVADIVEAEIASILCWSLHALGSGRWPDCDHRADHGPRPFGRIPRVPLEQASRCARAIYALY